MRPGFTLLELILVILIMAVLLGLSTPEFRKTFNNMQFSRSCSDLSAVLNYARQRAIFTRTEYQVRLDLTEAKFWIEYKGKSDRVYSLPKGIVINSDKDRLTFYPDGRADSVTITISNDAKSRTFTTEGTRGHVK